MKKRIYVKYLAIGMGLMWGTGCQQKMSLEERTLPENPVAGSFVIETDLDGEINASRALKEAVQPIAEQLSCQLEGPEEVLWDQGSGTLPTSLLNTFHLSLSNCHLSRDDMDHALKSMLNLDIVKSVEAESKVQLKLAENDPYRSKQYYHSSIRRDEACDLEKGAGKPVIVAVVDSGVEKNHPDLVDRFYRSQNGQIIGANFSGKGARMSPDSNWGDGNGHGTHVAGLIAATANNSQGISGVASCKNVLIMPIRVMGSDGSGSSIEIDRGVQWAAANGADIINLSLGSNSFAYSKKSSHKKSLYETLNKQGVIVFAAAGNDGFRNGSQRRNGYIYSYPASYDGVIAVAATNEMDQLTEFSVYGDHIDVAAPGEDTLSTYPGSTYKYLSGTSMASPIAAGAYALALSQVRDSGREKLFHSDLMELLSSSSRSDTSFSGSTVAARGVINSKLILSKLRDRFPAQGEGQEEGTSPVDAVPETTPVETPEEAPEAESPSSELNGLQFIGLDNGYQMTAEGIEIKLRSWPEGTSRVNLYWITGNEWFPRSFLSLGQEHLGADGVLRSDDKYVLYGTKYLVAEAVDAYGRSIETKATLIYGF